MPHTPASPVGTLRLNFRPHEAVSAHLDEPVRDNVSVAEAVGRCLFVGQDEGARIERLVAGHDGSVYGNHVSYPLSAFFDLPSGQDGEADIEGLAVDGGWLWITGSHSLARKKPKTGEHDAAQSLARLTEVKCEPNRYLLGRIPMVPATEDGVFDLVREDGDRRAACVKMGSSRNKLAKLLKDDEHIGRFLKVPAKENGFDVEGIAVRGDRVFLGLRGPVLRGWALMLELTLAEEKPGRLALQPCGGDGLPCLKHFLDLDGLGIRELTFDGDDLLILAGPTMDLDGPVHVWRWTGCLDATHQTVIPRERLQRVIDIPFGVGFDHAEGISRIDRPGVPPLLAVVYDNPGKARLHADGTGIDADLFAIG